ncbi:MAG: hemY [Friedmanniella sp.]|nr:hemY [Friedmanniella sp.]
MTRVLVVGGGVTGLAAARRLLDRGLEVTVLEAGPRWGGKLSWAELDGVRLDTGAESVLARRPEAVGLIADLGLGDRTVHPTRAKPALLVEGALHPLPPSLQGIPVDLDALRPLLTDGGWARARDEQQRPAPPLEADISIGDYVDERLGPEVTDRLLEPLLGGVYAGRARDLSFDAVFHNLFLRAARGGSLVDHARASLRPSVGSPVFAGLRGGVSGLVDALVADLEAGGATLRLDTAVRELVPAGSGYRLTCGSAADPVAVSADAVLLAAPAAATGRLLGAVSPVGQAYARVPYASVAVLTLVVRGLESDRSGLLVPPGQLPTIKALTHSWRKWDWVADAARATWGDDTAVVRASVGRIGEAALLQLPDDALRDRTWAEARTLPGWAETSLVAAHVTRWGGALPQYRVGHRELVAGLRDSLEAHPRLAVAGAALDGVGIAACIGSAQQAADRILSGLGAARNQDPPERHEESTA